MLTHILPMVHGTSSSGKRFRWFKIAALHSLGNALSAAFIGGIVTLLIIGLSSSNVGFFGLPFWGTFLVVFLYLPRQLAWSNFPPLLQSTWQVPRDWAYTFSPEKSGFYFGLALGSGFLTRIVTPVFYLQIIWSFLFLNPHWALVFWLIYGLARSGNVWYLAIKTPLDNTWNFADQIVYGLLRKERWMKRANAIVLLTAAVWLLLGVYFQ